MKIQKHESVVQEWVSELPFMQQALLMTGMRGPDGCPKYNGAKDIVRYLRGAVLKPAGEITGNEDSFMWIDYNHFKAIMNSFFSDTDSFPMHFLMHLFHCAEVVGYKHDNPTVRDSWLHFYKKACSSFHMLPESESAMDNRMYL